MTKTNRIVSGLQNQRIELFRQSNVSDGYGGITSENVSYWQTYANTKQLSNLNTFGSETNQDRLINIFQFNVRYRVDKNVLVDDLILYRGKYFVVKEVLTDYVYKDYLTITAQAND